MDSSSKSGGAVTPAKEKTARSKLNESLRHSENVNPNVSSPVSKFSNSSLITKSEKSAKKSASRNPNPNPKQLILASPSPKKKIRERKFVIAKKKARNQEQSSLGAAAAGAAAAACEKCKKATGKYKCLCVAYESLRASQEDFFKNRDEIEDEVSDKLEEFDLMTQKESVKLETKLEGDGALSEINRENKVDVDESTANDDTGVKRSRDRLLEDAKVRVRTPGSGRVMNLVKEFEKLSMFKSGISEDNDVEEAENDKVGVDSDGLEQRPKAPETQVSSSSFCPSNFYLTSESLGLDLRRSYSLDSNDGSISTITSTGGQKNRRSSTESAAVRTRRLWKRKQRKVTSQKPFMLRTEERGRCKEEEFLKKLQQMIEEEEKMRVPIAQGLPWTTDEPECLVKPPVKEITRPVDLVLHSDVRAVDRSEFDHQVAMKMNLIEQYRMERERQQKLAEEEEIRRLRKELVPKAQPMPYFDRPFIPRRSEKQPTIPKEPKFNLPQQKKIKCNLSLDDFTAYCQ
ncbi:microtubule-destabilizing protein 60 isoform X2 [Salvia miltiorrhiza]|uniref:microtubule-destabilizing protein 60 isoform X2 n=1 Tax=Salvia miltiorrhiza TaxID=226208 RepID=UPI0025AC5461|nr:microtubule-destabilizing protein 60 isoform X2 [Salvia miltiorrhiza]